MPDPRAKARDLFWSEHDRVHYECPDCGRSEAELPGSMEVHHRDGDVRNNDLENLIGLCRFCHNLREGKHANKTEQRTLRNQFASEHGGASAVRVCNTYEEYEQYRDRRDDADEVTIAVRQISTPRWRSESYGCVHAYP